MFYTSEVEVQMASIESIENRTIFNKRFFKKKSLKQTIIDSNCDIVHVQGFANFTVWQSLLVALNVRKKVVYTPHFHPFSALEKPVLGRLFFYARAPCLSGPLRKNLSFQVELFSLK